MQPTQNHLYANQQSAHQEGETTAPVKRNRDTLEERTESTAKKRKIEMNADARISPDSVETSLSDKNARVAMQIDSVSEGSPAFATLFTTGAVKHLSLQEEILEFIESKIKIASSARSNSSQGEGFERFFAYLNVMLELASTNRLSDVLQDGEFQGASIPLYLAKESKWEILQRMIDSKIDINFGNSLARGPYEGASVFLISILAAKWDLTRFIVKNKKPIDVNAVLCKGRAAGANALYLLAYFRRWDLVNDILTAYPHVDINARPDQEFLHAPAKATVIHLAALGRQWDIVKSLLNRCSECQMDTVLECSQWHGLTLPIIAAADKQWDVLEMILKNYPGLNINAAQTGGEQEGCAVLYFLAKSRKWDLFSTVLDLYPHASVSAAVLQGPDKGRTPLLLAAEMRQWELVAKALKLQPDADVDASCQSTGSLVFTPFWYAANNHQWPIALSMLSIKPHLNLECGHELNSPITAALNNKQHGFAKLFLILGAKDPLPDSQEFGAMHAAQGTVPPAQIARYLRQSLEETRARIYDALCNAWDQPENDTFARIRQNSDLRSQIACEILLTEHPDIPHFQGLSTLIDKWANLDERRNVAAKERTAILAYKQYRRNNGLFERPMPRAIKDIRQLIIGSITEVEKSYPFQCTRSTRRKIVKQIGVKQQGEPCLPQTYLLKAITNAVMPDNSVSPVR
ncbi:hypothetical protein [Estrella lausannensis]|uniref:Uncharacterized protein n=1 Tax=Estrella lausannensis TaxID=483423 RepID=A0A0H5DP78_9BACT|nr:hypothetical protein [Estrella lausannensis]CRX38182.1 hypothetical protein ELAC_0833 [Estrella lausannensis]